MGGELIVGLDTLPEQAKKLGQQDHAFTLAGNRLSQFGAVRGVREVNKAIAVEYGSG